MDYTLHPGKPHFWVNLHKGRLRELDSNSNIVLDNPNFGKYTIPFSAIRAKFDLADPAIDFWRIWIAATATQPHVFTIQSCQTLPEGGKRTLGTVGFVDARSFFTPLEIALGTTTSEEEENITVEESESATTSGGFQLEHELEGFIDANWSLVPFGLNLEKKGRQVTAGEIGTMDFLAQDRESHDYVVIELKRDKSSDVTIGQTLRYMSWVAHDKAEGHHNRVRGIIVCQEQDPKLKYAVSGLAGRVKVLEYKVNFTLNQAATI